MMTVYPASTMACLVKAGDQISINTFDFGMPGLPGHCDPAPRSTRQEGAEMTTWFSPDCRDGNHQKCDRVAWDEEADDGTDCGCECHIEVVEVEILPDITGLRRAMSSVASQFAATGMLSNYFRIVAEAENKAARAFALAQAETRWRHVLGSWWEPHKPLIHNGRKPRR